MRPNRNLAALLLAILVAAPVHQATADVVIEWNKVASDVLLANQDYQNPGMASRSMAMANIAMYDAINSIRPKYTPMYRYAKPATKTSEAVAALQASYRVLSAIYPDQQSMLDGHREAMLDTIPDGIAKSRGVHYGDYVGANVIRERSGDGFDNMVEYSPSGEIGDWAPDPMNPDQLAWGPAWGEVKTFATTDSFSMMPTPMPELSSDAYTHAFDEVKSLGALDSSVRTDEQTEIALFWAYDRKGMGTPMRMYNSVLRSVAESQGNSMEDNARLFALATTSMADAGITAWDSKFEYDFWRPVTGIRMADSDGNSDTIADLNWTPLGAPGGVLEDGTVIPDFTPPFPTYISGHASFGGALFQSLQNFYGTDEIGFSVRSDEMDGAMRSFDSFSAAMKENGRSRVYLGVHWDFDDLAGQQTGMEVANYVAANHFQGVPEPTSARVLMLGLIGLACTRRRP